MPSTSFLQNQNPSSIRTSSTSTMHFMTPTPESPLNPKQCSICGLVASSQFHLKEHMMIHTGLKRFSCTYCDYTCIKSSSLKLHLRKHTGEKPYSCPYCPHSSSDSSNLKRHINVIHADFIKK